MYTESEYLQAALASGMIDLTTLRQQIEMKERLKYLENHKIWQGKNGFWYTKLDVDGKKKLIKKAEKEAVEKLIIQHEKNKKDDPTVKEVFYSFINQKLRYKDISKSTYDRYESDYQRYFSGKEIEKMRFRSLTGEYLEDFIRCTIADNDLTSKGYANLRTIIRGMLLYAKGKYTDISAKSFFGDMQFSKNTFRRNIQCKEEQVFTEEEIALLIADWDKHKCLRVLGLKLALQLGLRVGELSALKKQDIVQIDGNTYIHIQRTETRYKENGKYIKTIKEYPKSEAGDRYVYCTENTIQTLKEILAFENENEYLLVNPDGNRFHIKSFDNALRRSCKRCKLKVRSMHKLRKTFGTALIDGGVDESIIIEQMGHSDIHCTKQYYYFSNKNRERQKEQLTAANRF